MAEQVRYWAWDQKSVGSNPSLTFSSKQPFDPFFMSGLGWVHCLVLRVRC